MKTSPRLHLKILSCAVVAAGIAPAAHAEFKCDGRPLARADAIACAHAAQGADSLRRFVARTQKIYGWHMNDYVRFVGDEERKRQSVESTSAVANALPTK